MSFADLYDRLNKGTFSEVAIKSRKKFPDGYEGDQQFYEYVANWIRSTSPQGIPKNEVALQELINNKMIEYLKALGDEEQTSLNGSLLRSVLVRG